MIATAQNWVSSMLPTPKHVFDIGGVEIWAGSLEKMPGFAPDLIVALESSLTVGPVVKLNSAALALIGDNLTVDQPEVLVDWPDGGVPSLLGRKWWDNLYDAIAGLPFGAKVYVGCRGGEGRTGTALSILWALTFASGDPVQAVRNLYSPYAVETAAQVGYIKRVTGRNFSAYGSYQKEFVEEEDRWREFQKAALAASSVAKQTAPLGTQHSSGGSQAVLPLGRQGGTAPKRGGRSKR